ncbi:MAG: hypothetical protein R3E89_15920 [Thiolinea sp.]
MWTHWNGLTVEKTGIGGYLAVKRAPAETVLQPPPVLSHFIRQKNRESAQQSWEFAV